MHAAGSRTSRDVRSRRQYGYTGHVAAIHTRAGRLAVLAVVAVSAPISLAMETLLRKIMLPPEFEELRRLLNEVMTFANWWVVGLTVAAGVLGIWAGRRVVASIFADPRLGDETARSRRLLDRMMLTTSIPQVPTIFSTLLVMIGSDFLPAFVCMGVSSAFIVAQGLDLERNFASGARPQTTATT
jgi:hypothetical protein